MTQFTVLYANQAIADLAEIWLAGVNKASITSSSKALDVALSTDPVKNSSELSEGLRSIQIRPLRAIFEIQPEDRKVIV